MNLEAMKKIPENLTKNQNKTTGTEKIIPVPIIHSIKVKFSNPKALVFESVEDDQGFIES